MKILITGGKGMLGSACSEIFSINHQVQAPGKDELNVTKAQNFKAYEKFKPDLIIHCAAIVNADYCEDHPKECQKVQVIGTQNTLEFARKMGARFIYPQSFLIFDGKEIPIKESTTPNPLSVYGKAKLEAEQKVLLIFPNALVIRMGGFFGGFDKDKNFVGKFANHLENCLEQRVKSVDVGDRIWQPTFTLDLAANLLLLVEKKKGGIYNMASHGQASFFELAVAMTEELGISNQIRINPIPASTIKEKSQRPSIAVMENSRLSKEGLDKMRPWRKALKEYLNQSFFKNLFSKYAKSNNS